MLETERRKFIALVGGSGLLLTVKVKRAWGQQPAKIPRIGILNDARMWQPFPALGLSLSPILLAQVDEVIE